MKRNCGFFSRIASTYHCLFSGAERLLYPILDLAMRLWLANIFFKSGSLKIGRWESTIFLFQSEYSIPFLSPEVAAGLSATVELGASLLLAIGLLTRLSALSLLGLTVIIELTYMDLEIHYFWMFTLSTIMLKGPSVFSIDYWWSRWLGSGHPHKGRF